MAWKDFLTGSQRNRVLVGSAGAIGLVVSLVVGISALTPAYQVQDDDGQNVWGVNFRGDQSQSGTLVVDGAIASSTLANCNTIDGTSTGMLVCGTDATGAGGGEGTFVNTGALLVLAEGMFVNQGGDTMTGALIINMEGGSTSTIGFETPNTASASIIRATDLLTSSGALAVESGIYGSGLSACNSDTGKLTWLNGTFSCGTDDDDQTLSFASPNLTISEGNSIDISAIDTNTVYFAGEGLSLSNEVFSRIATLTGTSLEVYGTASGRILHAQDELRSSGSLVVEGTVTIGVGNLSDGSINEPDLSADNSPSDGDVLTYDSTGTNFAWITPNAGTDITADLEEETHATEHSQGGADAITVENLASSCSDAQVVGGDGAGGAECQTDANTTYSAAQGLTLLAGNSFRLNATITGSLLEFSTVSGAIVHAQNELRSSGSLLVDGLAYFNGDMTLGDATSDTVTFTARIAGGLHPTGSAQDIGTTLLRWDELFVDGMINLGTFGDLSTIEYNETTNAIEFDSQDDGVDLYINDGSVEAGTLSGATVTSSGGTITLGKNTVQDTKCIWFEDPTADDDFSSIWRNSSDHTYTFMEIWAESDQTVNFDLQINGSDVNGSDISPAAGEAEDTSLSGDTTLGAGEELDLAITSVSGTPTWVSICWLYRKYP